MEQEETEQRLGIEESETLQQLAQATGHLPKGEVNDDPSVEESVEQEQETSAEPAETFEYDGQVFASEKDAFKYLQGRVGQLETERLLDEARLEGQREALQYIPQVGQPTAPVPEPEEEINMDEFYENPSKFLKDYGKRSTTKFMLM